MCAKFNQHIVTFPNTDNRLTMAYIWGYTAAPCANPHSIFMKDWRGLRAYTTLGSINNMSTTADPLKSRKTLLYQASSSKPFSIIGV